LADLLTEEDQAKLASPAERLTLAIDVANRQIFQKAIEDKSLKGMGTTVTALLVNGGRYYVAHVGDSRAYLIRDGKIKRTTRDHSWVNEHIEMGLINEEQAKHHFLRNIITRSVGYQPELQVDLSGEAYRENDCFLLCSDGLSGLIDDDELLKVIREGDETLSEIPARLVKLACDHGGDDNITVVIIRVSSSAAASTQESA